jgi:PEGA domain
MRTKILLAGALALATSAALAQEGNPRVYITDSTSWEVGGGGAAVNGVGAATGSGGARPQTAEVIKTFNQRCSNVIITSRKDKADYVVVLDHEGGKSEINRDNKIAVFNNASGDAIFSRSTRSLGNAVKDACPVIYRDYSRRAAVSDSNKQVEASVKQDFASQTVVADDASHKSANVHVSSSPIGADINVDGKFVGSTPSILQLAPGDHVIRVEKSGFVAWQKSLHVVPGDVNVVATLNPSR